MTLSPVKKKLVGLAMGLSIAGFALTCQTVEASAATTYTTQQSDTFWKISKKLNVPLQELLDANPDINPLNVYAGLVMKLPGTAAAPAQRMLAAAEAPAAQIGAETPATPAANTVKAASGNVLSYNKTVAAVASAYTDTPGQNGGWGNVDYFGNPLQLGTIAVDPKVIPMGTKVYVTGYNFSGLPQGIVATASDMGGAIKGNRIDIFIPSSYGNVRNFGLQNVTVYVLN